MLLSGLSWSVKENESPVRCEWTELTPKIKCKHALSVHCLILSERERLQACALKESEVNRVRQMERESTVQCFCEAEMRGGEREPEGSQV